MKRIYLRRHRVLFPKQKEVFDLLEKDPAVEEVYFGGAAGPGKSSLGCFWQMYRRCKYAGTVGLIGRANFTDLEDTTVKTFWRIWERVGVRNPWGVTCNRVGNRILFSNGSEILLRWVRDRGGANADPNFGFGSLDLTDFFLDEVTEIPENVFEILSSRVRYKLIQHKPAMLVVSNPANNWVKERYIERSGQPVALRPHQRVVLASLADNKDQEFAQAYWKRLSALPAAARARLLGSWDYFENNNPFFFAFSEALVDAYEYELLEYEPLLLSFDFNVAPCTVVVGQSTNEYGLLIHWQHEAAGGTRGLLDAIAPYNYPDHPAGLIVTGDVSGHARHSSSAATEYGDLQTDYGIIKKRLHLRDSDIRHTAHQNPRHVYSRRVCNYAMHRQVLRFSLPGCSALIQEIRAAIPAPNGGLFKDASKGHANNRVDAFRYLNHMAFPNGFRSINNLADLLGLSPVEPLPDLDQTDVRPVFDSVRKYLEGKREF